jgi:hypothetical protein
MPSRIYFDHIPKSGGTSFHRILTSWFGEDHVSPPIAGQRYADVIVQYRHLAAISGHVNYGLGDKLSEDRVNVTIIRDPIDRALSQYFFNSASRANRSRQDRAMLELSLEAFLSQSDTSNLLEYSNVYVRHFASLCSDYHSGTGMQDEASLLHLAKHALSQFDVVGLLTEFEDFSAVAAISAGISHYVSPPRLRVTQNRLPLDRVSHKALKLLRDHNAMDIEFAAFAAELFRRTRTSTLIRSVSVSAADGHGVAKSSKDVGATGSRMISQEFGSREIEILSIVAKGTIGTESSLLTGEELSVGVTLLAHVLADDVTVGIHISDPSGVRIFGTNSRLLGMVISIAAPGHLVVEFRMKCELGRGEYLVGATVHKGMSHLEKCYHWISYSNGFNVLGILGSHFEGNARLYPSVRVTEGDHAPASYKTSEDDTTYPRTVMLQSPPLREYSATFIIKRFDYQPKSGEIFNLECSLTNRGSQAWPIAGTRPVSACYHWLHADHTIAVYDGIRTRLTSEISSGQTVHVLLQIQAPYLSGDYILQVTAVQDGVGWFDENGCSAAEIPVTVIQ